MAKAKKSEESKPAAEKKPAKKIAAKKSAPSSMAGFPMIDTGAAAAAAASMIRHKVSTDTSAASGAKKSTAGFQQMKDSLNRSPSTVVGGILGEAQSKKNSSAHSEFSKQVGHNQTFGADVVRSGVPRRTAG